MLQVLAKLSRTSVVLNNAIHTKHHRLYTDKVGGWSPI
jgi:hypothetical protein